MGKSNIMLTWTNSTVLGI